MASLHGRWRALAVCGFVLLLSTAAAPVGTKQVSAAAVDARVVGTVVDPDGSPVAGVDMTIVVTDTGFHFFSPPSSTVADTTTGDDGGYAGTLPDAYVAGTETDADWIVTASRRPRPGETAGPESSFEFEVNTAVQEAPALPYWDETPAVSIDGYQATVEEPGSSPPGMSVQTSIGSGSAGLSGDGTAATFDLRALEPEGSSFGSGGITARGSASADVRVVHSEGRTIYHQHVATPAVAVKGAPRLVPPSRGSPCGFTSTDGTAYRDQPCAATDGNFQSRVSVPLPETSTAPDDEPTTYATPPGVASVTLELTTPTDVQAVLVRGCDETCAVAVSADGSTWLRPVEAGTEDRSPPLLTAYFDPVAQARFVRISGRGSSHGLGVTEISAWEGRPPVPPAPPTTAVPSVDRADPTGTGTGPIETALPAAGRNHRPAGVVVLAAILLALVGAATAMISRRGHS